MNKTDKSNRPFVFARCLTYNHEKYIEDALKGFVMQKTDFPYVVVIVNDASPDNTKSVIEKYLNLVCRPNNIKHEKTEYAEIVSAIPDNNSNCLLYVLHLKENHYRKKSHRPYYQKFIDKATYWADCEGDDFWIDPLKLQKQVDIMEANPNVSICVNRVKAVDITKKETGWLLPEDTCIMPDEFTLEDYLREEFGKMQWVFQTSGWLTRCPLSDDWTKEEIMRMYPYGDMPLILYCLLHGNGFYIQEIMSCYRVDSGGYNSTANANPDKNIQDERKLAVALRAFDEFTEKKYHKYIQQRIRLSEYREYTLGKKHHWRIILPQYWRCIPGRTARQKTLSAIEIIAPNLRKRLKQMKNAIVHS